MEDIATGTKIVVNKIENDDNVAVGPSKSEQYGIKNSGWASPNRAMFN